MFEKKSSSPLISIFNFEIIVDFPIKFNDCFVESMIEVSNIRTNTMLSAKDVALKFSVSKLFPQLFFCIRRM